MRSWLRLRATVLGAGSWGTALAKHLSELGHSVRLWTRRKDHVEALRLHSENQQYLPGHKLSSSVTYHDDLEEALFQSDLILSVVPSHATRKVLTAAKAYIPSTTSILCASKGIEVDTLALMPDIFSEILPNNSVGFIGGPSFAKEVAQHHPTAIVIGSKDTTMARLVQKILSTETLRAYVTDDVVGIEVGGSLKNVIAIACGCADGLGLGHNSRAALITRGLAEITRLATQMGADPHTLSGLGGMGDLVLTCTGDLSRNRRVGLGLGQGKSLSQILEEMGQVAEGVKTTASAFALSQREDIEMPITQEVYQVLYEQKPVNQVVSSLMSRDLKHELDGFISSPSKAS